MDTLDSKEPEEMLDIKGIMKRLGMKRSTAYKLLAHEPGVLRIYIPGSKKPMIRVSSAVVERIRRRSAIPA